MLPIPSWLFDPDILPVAADLLLRLFSVVRMELAGASGNRDECGVKLKTNCEIELQQISTGHPTPVYSLLYSPHCTVNNLGRCIKFTVG